MAPSTSSEPKVWLITGCSSGFGREIALAALAHGDLVVATARNAAALQQLELLGATTMALDLTQSDEEVAAIVAQAVEVHGRIDILMNNAGFYLSGAVEECSSQEVAEIFETNVFGTLKVTRAVLPYLRKQRAGVVANMGSLSGRLGMMNMGLYGATKFALAGLSLALRGEVAHLGVEVTLIEPGLFRTKAMGANAHRAKKEINEGMEIAMQPWKDHLATISGNESGDPAKAGKLIVEVLTKSGCAAGKMLPARLAIGQDAVFTIKGVLAQDTKEQEEWAPFVTGTDFDGEKSVVEGETSSN
ncbi:hypothetical protein BBJ28_00008970 [Nothophytophthora sp. Chile5]|nr:hypothetical protein BBJ28_00008970 [Nothophytophthora sp. Chile5]